MAKKKMMKIDKMEMKKEGSCCNWSAKEWAMAAVSEAALYFFIWYGLFLLNADDWLGALILLVLVNVSFFTCPVTRKHFL